MCCGGIAQCWSRVTMTVFSGRLPGRSLFIGEAKHEDISRRNRTD